jgi:hypothetical protein
MCCQASPVNQCRNFAAHDRVTTHETVLHVAWRNSTTKPFPPHGENTLSRVLAHLTIIDCGNFRIKICARIGSGRFYEGTPRGTSFALADGERCLCRIADVC